MARLSRPVRGLRVSKATSVCRISYDLEGSALYGLRGEKRVGFVAGDVVGIPGMLALKDDSGLNVGAGLPAIAECQSTQCRLAHRYRRQASSHKGSAAFSQSSLIGNT